MEKERVEEVSRLVTSIKKKLENLKDVWHFENEEKKVESQQKFPWLTDSNILYEKLVMCTDRLKFAYSNNLLYSLPECYRLRDGDIDDILKTWLYNNYEVGQEQEPIKHGSVEILKKNYVVRVSNKITYKTDDLFRKLQRGNEGFLFNNSIIRVLSDIEGHLENCNPEDIVELTLDLELYVYTFNLINSEKVLLEGEFNRLSNLFDMTETVGKDINKRYKKLKEESNSLNAIEAEDKIVQDFEDNSDALFREMIIYGILGFISLIVIISVISCFPAPKEGQYFEFAYSILRLGFMSGIMALFIELYKRARDTRNEYKFRKSILKSLSSYVGQFKDPKNHDEILSKSFEKLADPTTINPSKHKSNAVASDKDMLQKVLEILKSSLTKSS